jgi:glutamyl-tRNA reductase
MVFIACGVNHKTAPVNVREQLALPVVGQESLLSRLVDIPTVNEAAILSTCNRTEIYCDTEEPEQLIPWIAKEHHLSLDTLEPHLYLYQGHQGVRHTLRVATGLDSMMLGEPQILGQMKQAYHQACRVGSIKTNLRHLFQYVFSATKRIRHQSGIGQNPVSIAYAAVQLIRTIFTDFNQLKVFIIGSGETATLVAKYLQKAGVNRFMIASRTQENASFLAQSLTGDVLSISDIPQRLCEADVVISATACPLPFINKTMVLNALNQRHLSPMFLLDLAVPRDIEASVGELENVHLYNIDDLKSVVDKGLHERQHAALEAEQLIDVELENYIRWHRSNHAKNIICDYRQQMQLLAQKELERSKRKLLTGECHYDVLTEFSERLLNKLTHRPTLGLRHAAWDNRQELLDLAQYLFDQSTYEKIT